MIARQLYQINVRGVWVTVSATGYMKYVGEKRIIAMVGERSWNAGLKRERLAA